MDTRNPLAAAGGFFFARAPGGQIRTGPYFVAGANGAGAAGATGTSGAAGGWGAGEVETGGASFMRLLDDPLPEK